MRATTVCDDSATESAPALKPVHVPWRQCTLLYAWLQLDIHRVRVQRGCEHAVHVHALLLACVVWALVYAGCDADRLMALDRRHVGLRAHAALLFVPLVTRITVDTKRFALLACVLSLSLVLHRARLVAELAAPAYSTAPPSRALEFVAQSLQLSYLAAITVDFVVGLALLDARTYVARLQRLEYIIRLRLGCLQRADERAAAAAATSRREV